MVKRVALVTAIIFGSIAWTPALQAADMLKKVKTATPRNSVFILSYFGGRDAGIWRKNGIDLDINPVAFPAYVASIPAKEVPVATYAGTAAIARINKGLDLVVMGGGLTVMQEVFVPKNAPFKSIGDLRGKKFGVWNTGAGAAKALLAALVDGFNLNYLKDTELIQAAGPALFALLKRGDVDSMFNISSLTIAAATEPDKYRSLFAPNEYWKEKTAYPIVWSAPVVAWRDWVDEDPERAKAHVAATMESFRWLRDPKNFDKAAEKYGKLAGIKSDAEAKTYKSWLAQEKFFLTEWNPKVLDAQWAFLEMAHKHGVIDQVPDKKKYGLVLN